MLSYYIKISTIDDNVNGVSETLTILTPKKEKKYDNAISKADNLSWIFG